MCTEPIGIKGSHSKRSGRTTGIALVLALAGLTLVAPPAGAAFPGKNGAIFFVRINATGPPFHPDIYSVRPDGTGLVRVTSTGSAEDPAVNWSGRELAYTGLDPEGHGQVFVALADGEGPGQITSSSSPTCCVQAGEPSFHPTANTLVFSGNRSDDDPAQLWLTDWVTPGPPTAITALDPDADHLEAEFSPDGNTIVFTRFPQAFQPGRIEIETIPASGGPPTPLVAGQDPSFSPDGSRIAFTESTGTGIDRIQPDGSDHQSLLPFGRDPSYSPDGRRIAFRRQASDPGGAGSRGLWKARASDGSNLARLTDPPDGFVDFNPQWAPAGAKAEPCDGPASITGTDDDDVLVGTKRGDLISGRGGEDKLRGKGGDDVLCGRGGDDTVRGGSGRDLLRGGAGEDRLLGGDGRDRCPGSQRDRAKSC